VIGYSLTGSTREHALFFLWGKGRNGKSVFISTIRGILADYHRAAAIETFTDAKHASHPTDLAGLHGARLVTSIKTEDGRNWAEKKIKALTGGDAISARFMRQDFFEYVPEFKLLIAGNHKPKLRSVDEAIKSRFNLIPFTVWIPPERRDPDLSEKLKAEWPGILQWMVEGCLEWQRRGLDPLKAVVDATNEYLTGEDAVLAWMDECCELEPDNWTPRTKLYHSWTSWAEKTGENVSYSARDFYAKLAERSGVHPLIRHGQRGFKGLRPKSEYGTD
jgi:putative DNA primase/helicase